MYFVIDFADSDFFSVVWDIVDGDAKTKLFNDYGAAHNWAKKHLEYTYKICSTDKQRLTDRIEKIRK